MSWDGSWSGNWFGSWLGETGDTPVPLVQARRRGLGLWTGLGLSTVVYRRIG
jgi:hypothetical protein